MLTEPQTQLVGNRYALHNTLGQGGMGVVYRATDRLTGRQVALKRVLTDIRDLHIGDTLQVTDFRVALAREFKLSASLRHPNIIKVLDYGFDDAQQPYFTMELLSNPVTVLEAAQGLTVVEQIGFLIQMLHALAYLHRRGIVHRDLKPANVLVVENQVKVLDFGLSIMHERANPDGTDQMTAGTLAYMAPEVLTGGGAGVPADIYAVGMMGFEILAGHHPFELADPGFLINQIIGEIPNVADLDIDYDLSLILEKLLLKDPEDRYQSAQEVIDGFNQAGNQSHPGETKAIRESFLQAARLVGRDLELKRLTESLYQAINGRSSGWLLSGESGVGKSRIIDEIRTLAMVNGALVMRGQAINVGSQPYQMWQMALRWLCLLEENLKDDEIALLKAIIADIETLLGQDVSHIVKKEIDPETLQTQMLRLLERVIKSQNRPVVMLFEDLHWAGSESLSALAQWTQSMNGMPVLIIGSYRDDEQPDLFKQLPSMEILRLRRLDQDAIEELSVAMLGEAGRSPQVVDLLKRETEGNVFFVVEIVRALAEEVGNLDEIGRMTLPTRVFAGGVQTVIQRRLNRLKDEDQRLLRYAGVMGRHLNVDLLSQIEPETDIQGWLAACANAAVLEVDDGDWRFAHDKLRVGLAEMMSEADQRECHQRVAEAMEALYGDAAAHIAGLAHHWGSAGNIEKEEYYVMIAGEQDLRIGAYHEAIDYFRRAQVLTKQLAISESEKRQKELRLHGLIGEAHLGFADYDTARSIYQDCVILADQLDDQLAKATATGYLGDVALVLGELETAHSYFEESTALHRGADNKAGVAHGLSRLGDVAYEMGEQAQAKQLYQESLNLAREIGLDWGMAGAVQVQDDADKGFATSSSLELLVGILAAQAKQNDEGSCLATLLRIGRACADETFHEIALEVASFLLYYSASSDEIQDEAEQLVFRLDGTLADDVREKAWESGKTRTLESIIEHVLSF